MSDEEDEHMRHWKNGKFILIKTLLVTNYELEQPKIYLLTYGETPTTGLNITSQLTCLILY